MAAALTTRKSRSNDRFGRMTDVATPLTRVVGNVLERRGFLDGKIIHNWPQIVGRMLASVSLPERITFPKGKRMNGTIHLRLANSVYSTELQHLQPIIIEQFFLQDLSDE